MIANRGLPEFDVVMEERGPCVALTLLRCVGWLSRDDLATRQGAAGPILATPGAQMLGQHTFEYSIIPHDGTWQSASQQARWFAAPLRSRWTGRHPGPLGQETSFLALSPATLVLSAAKLADCGDGSVILRLYNGLGEPAEAALRTFFPIASAEVTNLAEESGEPLTPEDARTLRFPVGPHQIVTLRLLPAGGLH
jgi:alpha-mannosidase